MCKGKKSGERRNRDKRGKACADGTTVGIADDEIVQELLSTAFNANTESVVTFQMT